MNYTSFMRDVSAIDEKATSDAEEDDDDNEDEDEDDDEEGDTGLVEKTFKFDDFVKRLLHPKIIRACSIVLVDWEKIPTKSLKSTVTILHRIAYGCSCPAMLYQAVLFKVFQQVFDAPRDPHSEELRRLGIYVVRKFVETAPKNPKIYAELFFYKTIRDANELETGYCDVYEAGTKGTWTEEQENELRFLFEENQNNPQTDQDVIDWILENLIDKTRSRRGVLKKLRELGLQFKVPTKKSTAASANKDLWQLEEDDELKALYDEYRLEEDCLQRIVDTFGKRRSKNHIIKRMIQLHLIADKSEILPANPRKRKSKKDEGSGEDNGSVGDGKSTKSKPSAKKKTNAKQQQKRKIVRTPLDIGTVRLLLANIDEKFSDALEWLKESFADAAEDTDVHSEEDDGVPLLPLLEVQKDAMEDSDFQRLILALGAQPPIAEMENYWRIPVYLNAADLKLRERILGSEDVDDNELIEEVEDEEVDAPPSGDESSGAESEEDYLDTFMNKRREQMNSLLYNKSDDEDEQRVPLVAREKATSKSSEKSDEDKAHDGAAFKKPSKKNKQKAGKMNLFDMVKGTREDTPIEDREAGDELDFNSEDYRQRLAELGSSDSESDNEAEATIIENTSMAKNRSRARNNRIESDSDEDDGDKTMDAPAGSIGGKKRPRSIDDEGDANGAAPSSSNDNDDDDELFIRRKEVPTGKTKLGEEPKRRRIAIIDDDDEDGADF